MSLREEARGKHRTSDCSVIAKGCDGGKISLNPAISNVTKSLTDACGNRTVHKILLWPAKAHVCYRELMSKLEEIIFQVANVQREQVLRMQGI